MNVPTPQEVVTATELGIGLAAVFAAGFAVQQAIEFLDAIFFWLIPERWKRAVLTAVSIALGFGFAGFGDGNIRLLEILGITSPADMLITALFISAGTEGINSLLKFLQYKKEEKKGEAAKEKGTAGITTTPPPSAELDLPTAAVPQGI